MSWFCFALGVWCLGGVIVGLYNRAGTLVSCFLSWVAAASAVATIEVFHPHHVPFSTTALFILVGIVCFAVGIRIGQLISPRKRLA